MIVDFVESIGVEEMRREREEERMGRWRIYPKTVEHVVDNDSESNWGNKLC